MTTDSAKIIPLTRDEFTIVDADDYERLSKYKWFYKVGGTGGDGYAARSHRVNGKVCTVRMHREIVNAPPPYGSRPRGRRYAQQQEIQFKSNNETRKLEESKI